MDNVAVTPDAVSIRISTRLAENLMAAAGWMPSEFEADRIVLWENEDDDTTTLEEGLLDALETVAESLA